MNYSITIKKFDSEVTINVSVDAASLLLLTPILTSCSNPNCPLTSIAFSSPELRKPSTKLILIPKKIKSN